jgi:hypothetical protein
MGRVTNFPRHALLILEERLKEQEAEGRPDARGNGARRARATNPDIGEPGAAIIGRRCSRKSIASILASWWPRISFARGIMERTPRDLSVSVIQAGLRQALERHAKGLKRGSGEC